MFVIPNHKGSGGQCSGSKDDCTEQHGACHGGDRSHRRRFVSGAHDGSSCDCAPQSEKNVWSSVLWWKKSEKFFKSKCDDLPLL